MERDPAVLGSLLSTAARLVLDGPVVACASMPADEGWTVLAWLDEPTAEVEKRLPALASELRALTDVTILRERAEAAEAGVSQILGSVSLPIVIAGSDTPPRLNPAAARLLGLPTSALLDANALAAALQALVGRATNAHAILPKLTEVLRNDAVFDDWLWLYDSEPTHLVVSSWPLPASSGGGRVWTFRDESRAYRLLDEERALAESRRRFEEAIDLSGIATALLSPEGRFLVVNPAMARFLGRGEDELLDSNWVELTHPDDLPANLADVQEMRQEKRDRLETTKRYRRPDGSYVYGHLMLNAVRRADGTLDHQVAQILDVDEAVRAQQRADRERARFQASIEAMLDPHIVLAPVREANGDIVDYFYLEANRAACEYNGLARDQLVGARFLELFPAVRDTEIWTTCLEASTAGTPGVLDDFWLHNDLQGRPRYYDIRIIPVGDELSYTWRDVTERHEAVQGVVDSEALLRAILDGMPDSFALFSPVRDKHGAIVDFEYVDVNQAFCDYTGMAREALRGLRASALWPHFTSTSLFDLERQLMASGEPLALDAYRYEDVLGPGRDAYFTIRAARVEGFLALLARDVTAQQREAKAVIESERRYRMLAENTSDIVAVSKDGIFDWISPSITRALGWAPEEMLGRRNEDFIHPEDTSVMRSLRPTHGIAQGTRLRYRVPDVEGDYHWLDVSAGPLLDDQGAPIGLLASGRVIDDQVHAEQALISAREAALASAAAKAAFLANMSHEIRTPLTAVLGLLQLMDRTTLSPEQAGYTERARQAANFLLDVLNAVLDYSKIEAGALEVHLAPVTLVELVGEVSEIVRNSIGDKPLEVRTAIDPATPALVLADGLRLRQVLLNLASNAVKFTPAGTVTLAIDVLERTVEHCRLRVSVADTGIGIHPGALGRIFEGFTQAEASTARRFGGTGLGLTISRSLVQLMGTDLEVHSAVGAGSTFAFTVELALSEPPPRDPAPDRPAAEPLRPLAGLRILLAEDNEVNSAIASELLQLEGAQVWTALDGAEAVALALDADQHFEAVLMDVQMPQLDGMEATRRIRAVPRLAELPIIALTAHSSLVEKERCLEAGMDAYLTKPFVIGELAEEILRRSGRAATGPAPLPTRTTPAVDGAAALALLDGNRALYARVLRGFVAKLPTRTDELASAIRRQDRTTTVELAHSLKGAAATLGAHRLNAVAIEIETAFRSAAPPSDVDSFLKRLQAATAETVHAAQPWL